MSTKTEQPTPRRLRRAREEGDIPVSPALIQAFAFLAVVLAAPAVIRATSQQATLLIERAVTVSDFAFSPQDLVSAVLSSALPLLVPAAFAAFAAGLLQTGGVVAFRRIAPDLGRTSPMSGFARLFNRQRGFQIFAAFIGSLIVAWLAFELLQDEAPLLAGSIGNAAAAAAYAADIAWRLAWLVATMGVILAVLDFVVARHAWLISHRMSRADIQREARETAGDPEMKARRREAHQHMMRSADYDTENRERKP